MRGGTNCLLEVTTTTTIRRRIVSSNVYKQNKMIQEQYSTNNTMMYHYFSTNNKGPTTTTTSKRSTSWERSAKLVKNTDVTNKYLEHIRDMHDPSLHIKTMEDELCESMGKALGKQGEKIKMALHQMELELINYQKNNTNSKSKIKAAIRYNEYRNQAIQARWELKVHRQAVGFIIGNHEHVTNTFPIPDALPIPPHHHDDKEHNHEKDENSTSQQVEPVQRTFGTQLDWWQQIGRWK